MDAVIQNIWKAVNGLRQADDQSTALCYSLLNLMIKQGVVTREEATRQIEKSTIKVVAIHKQIAEAMQEQSSDAGEYKGSKTVH